MKFSHDTRLRSHKYDTIEEYFITWIGVCDKRKYWKTSENVYKP